MMILRLGSAVAGSAVSLLFVLTAHAGTTYCCFDERNIQTCSDTLPYQCYGRAYREINESGMTVRRVDAPLTSEQRAQREVEIRKAREEELKRKEQDRKNRALLATYSSEKDINYVRDLAVVELEKTIKVAQNKQAELVKRQQKLNDEAEFYKKKDLPPELKAQMRDNESDMKALLASIETKQKEIEALKVRYEAEKLRYRELTSGKKAASQGSASPLTGSDARPR